MRICARIPLVALICLAMPVAAISADGAKKPVTLTPDQMKWAPNPNAAGVMTAAAWGNAETGPHGAFHKFAAGFTAPLHTHSANTKVVVLSGTMAMVGEDGKELQFPAGSFYTQPNTFKHITKCLGDSGCLVYLEADAKWDLKPSGGK